MDIEPPFTPARPPSPGEVNQVHASMALMVVAALGMKFTAREQDELAGVLNAFKRELPKIDPTHLFRLLELAASFVPSPKDA